MQANSWVHNTHVYTWGHEKCTCENTYVCKHIGMYSHTGTHTRAHMGAHTYTPEAT